MSEWRNEIVRIEKVQKHPYADALDICFVLGDYPVITKLGEYQAGDLACYIAENTLVPDTEMFYFLCPKKSEKYEEDGEIKFRTLNERKYPLGSVPERHRIIFSKKIRQIYSEGLLLPVPSGNWQVGDSVNDYFGLLKFEKEEEEEQCHVKNRSITSGSNARKAPTTWNVPYYDINNLRSNLHAIWPGEEVVCLEKLHGSWSFFLSDLEGEFWVKSRNYFKKESEYDSWWKAARLYQLPEKLKQYPMLGFCGELVGFQKKFPYDSEIIDQERIGKLHFFHIFDVLKNKQLPYDDVVRICQELELPVAPLVYRGPWLGKEKTYQFGEGPSLVNPSHIREGFVLQTLDPRRDEYLGQQEFKFVGEGYKLSKV